MLHRNLGLAIAVAIVLGLTAQLHAGKPCCCPVTLCPPCEAAPAAPAAPPAAPAAEPADVSAPSDFDLASSLDAGSAPQAVAPNMIGDMFGPSGLLDLTISAYSAHVDLPGVGGRRVKIAENNSPMPRDRFFHTYNHFHNALSSSAGNASRDFDVNRFTFGVEKTFADGLLSVEVRLPFADTLESDMTIPATGVPGTQGVEFGNIALAFKGLLYQDPQLAVAAGLGINLPTADDAWVDPSNLMVPAGSYLRVDNDTVDMAPYLAALWTPDGSLFMQSFMQFSIPLNGNDVFYDLGTGAGNASLNEQALLHLDSSIGYWIYRDGSAGLLTGIAPIAELHFTGTLEDADLVQLPSGYGTLGNVYNRLDTWNATMGVTFEIANQSTLTTAMVLPLNNEGNRQFDAEFSVQLNYYFGARTRGYYIGEPF